MASHGARPRSEGTRTRNRVEHSKASPRVRLACRRCQRQKIRCDGQLPACKGCRNAGVVCADGESVRSKDLPRAYVTSLKDRIGWLESIVRDRCPDIDLASGPGAAEIDDGRDGRLAASDTLFDDTTGDGISGFERGSENPSLSHQAEHRHPDPGDAAAGGTTVNNALSHEIGLVSLGANQDPRYIGPSSGYVLARVMLSKISIQSQNWNLSRSGPFSSALVEATQGPLPLPALGSAQELCAAYFDYIHPQYPVLHQPTFMKTLARKYEEAIEEAVPNFQIFMVLALGAIVLSGQMRTRLPAESYCLSALQYFEGLNVENSLQGAQCLVLLLVFTIHSPYVKLNAWYLNYHCLASLLDLGLQRDVNVHSGITPFEQEMRARIFWVVYGLDRTLATMMGRPIGVRDEACELRYPRGLSDEALASSGAALSPDNSINTMSFSVHLFKLSRLNSEIKYVVHSIVRGAPSYAYPTIVNINDWQDQMLQQLDEWADNIPPAGGNGLYKHLNTICRLRYHRICMLLLRPSPAITKPREQTLIQCYNHSRASISISNELYRANMLLHSWLSFHSLLLSSFTMLYCIKAVPSLSQSIKVADLMADLSSSLSILSATGEHWSGAKRCREILDELGRSTITWFTEESRTREPGRRSRPQRSGFDGAQQQTVEYRANPSNGMPSFNDGLPVPTDNAGSAVGADFTPDIFDDPLPSSAFLDYFEATDSINIDNMVRDMFQDFIPSNMSFG